MKLISLFRRRKELSFRFFNTLLLRWLKKAYARHGIPGTFHVNRDGALYEINGMKFEFYFSEYGCTGNIDSVGLSEPATRVVLFSAIPQAAVFYDIGAHEGLYTLEAKTRRPDLTVYSFEPLAERLIRNLILNGQNSRGVHAVALGNESGTVMMDSSQRSKSHVAVDNKGSVEVPIVKLDSYVGEKGLSPPDYIKIDIEGMEHPALKGAEGLLREHQPVIICEINQTYKRYYENLGDFLSYLRNLDYRLYRHWGKKMIETDVTDKAELTVEDIGASAFDNYWLVPKKTAWPPSENLPA